MYIDHTTDIYEVLLVLSGTVYLVTFTIHILVENVNFSYSGLNYV